MRPQERLVHALGRIVSCQEETTRLNPGYTFENGFPAQGVRDHYNFAHLQSLTFVGHCLSD